MEQKSVKKRTDVVMRLWPVRKTIAFLESVKPPGMQGLSLYQVSRFFIEALMKGQVATRASAISFRLFLAFFPGIILLLSLIPYIPIPNFQQSLFDSIRGFFPGDTFSLFESTLNDLINTKHSTLLSLGFVLVIYYASNSINAVLIGFSGSYFSEEKGNAFIMRIASIILIFILGLLLVVAVSIMAFSGYVFNYLHDLGIIGDAGFIPLLNIAKWMISVFLIYSIISTLYNVGLGKRWRRWRFFNVGATLATFVFVITSIGFAYFVNNFATYNKLYGSLGTLMVLLIWLNFNCMIVLMGYDLNVSIRKAKKSIPPPPPPPEPPIKNSFKEEKS
ncbi:MAG TPA: YihY/virulence factor BrkB family protein [Flavobacteriales bacterium]